MRAKLEGDSRGASLNGNCVEIRFGMDEKFRFDAVNVVLAPASAPRLRFEIVPNILKSKELNVRP
jgi:hypothetical protein